MADNYLEWKFEEMEKMKKRHSGYGRYGRMGRHQSGHSSPVKQKI